MSSSKKVLAVASAGGHWTQLLLLNCAFGHGDVHYLTTNINRSAVQTQGKLTTVIDADLSTKLKLIPLALQVLFAVLKTRPDIVISTGAAPGFFAVLFGRLLGAKTIWVDSMANYSSMSVSGKYASRVCHLCLTQWPDVADGKKIKYAGGLL